LAEIATGEGGVDLSSRSARRALAGTRVTRVSVVGASLARTVIR